MSNNLFYKTISIIGTLGVVVLSSTQLWTTLRKETDAEAEISKTLIELKKERKETLNEIKSIKLDLLKELDSLRLGNLNELKNNKANALNDLNRARKEALEALEASINPDAKIWLIMRSSVVQGGNAIHKIPFTSMERCQEAELELESSDGFAGRNRFFFTMCIDAR